MKNLILTFAILFSYASNSSAGESIYSQQMKSFDRKVVDFSQFKNKPILIVNIATRCGYTGQLKGFEELHKKYKAKGLVVIGVPSNEFGGQTPEKDKEVKNFCSLKYGVSFLITAKSIVKGPKKHKLFEILTTQGKNKNEISWNFEKFLIDKTGKVVGRFSSDIEPNSKELEASLKKIL